MNKSMRGLLLLSLPITLLILSCLCLLKISILPELFTGLMPLLPYVILLITCILAYHFNQSNFFYLSLAFIAIQFITSGMYSQQLPVDRVQMDFIYSLIIILIPLNLVILSFLKERGITSFWGLLKLFFLIVQFLGAAWIYNAGRSDIHAYIYTRMFPWQLSAMQGIAQFGILLLCLSVVSLLFKLWYKNEYFTSTSIGILFSIALMIYFRTMPLAEPIFISCTGVMMIICILQNVYSMAYLDELTEIPGRRALNEELMRLSGSYAVAIVDIDFFKKFNDTYGHDVGDEMLRMVASKIKRVTGGGKAFRYGGEEFVIVFAGKKLADIVPHLEKLRETIAHSEFAIRGKDRPKKKPAKPKAAHPVKKTSVTVSIGAAEKKQVRDRAQEVLKEADKALYRAKKKGRNCICK